MTGNTSLIDEESFQGLRDNDEGDTSFSSEAVGTFLQTSRSSLETIEDCLAKKDFLQAASEAGAVKSAAASVGATRFTDDAFALQSAVSESRSSGDQDSLMALLVAMKKTFTDTEAWYRDFYSRQPDAEAALKRLG
ncbi:Hpt domain-containing protein [Kitasatospora sp. NPDC004240]